MVGRQFLELSILVRIQVPEHKEKWPIYGLFFFLFRGVFGFEQWKGETGRFHMLRKGIGKPEGFPRRRSRLRIAQRQVPEHQKIWLK